MSRLFAIAIPVAPDKEQEFRKFISDIKDTHYEDFMASRHKMGVRERTFLQHTPMGTMVIVTLEGENPEEAFTKFGQGDDAFSKWFAEGVKNVHGIDLNAPPPPGPLPELIVDSGPVKKTISAEFN